MAIFKEREVHQELDWFILRNGGVSLYWRLEILTDDMEWLKSNDYKVISFEAGEWHWNHREWLNKNRGL